MKTYMVRQPIVDQDQNVLGYEILYNSNAQESAAVDTYTSNTVESFLTQVNTEKFLDGKVAFLTFSPNLLFRNIPQIFDSHKLVIQIDETILIYPMAQKTVNQYRDKGYKVAICGFGFSPRYFNCLDMVDYIKLNFAATDKKSYENIVMMAKQFGKEIIAYNVNTMEDHTLAEQLGIRYMQGSCIGKSKQMKTTDIGYLQSNFFQFMAEVTKEEPDMDKIEEIISRDVTLTFSLIKLVNSAYFALRNQVKSVREALMVLGLGQLKKWVYILSFKNGQIDAPSEVIRTSFLRATFCSALVPYAKSVPLSASEAYLMGMFSTLDSLMDISLETALAELPIPEEIKHALLTHEGPSGQLYDLVLAYENANWAMITEYAEKLDIPMNILTQKYFECVESVNKIWHELMDAYDAPKADQ